MQLCWTSTSINPWQQGGENGVMVKELGPLVFPVVLAVPGLVPSARSSRVLSSWQPWQDPASLCSRPREPAPLSLADCGLCPHW